MRTKGEKMTRRRFCEICHRSEMDQRGRLIYEPIWALQYIACDTPTFYKLGSHIRGFGLIRICDDCRAKFRRDENDDPGFVEEPDATCPLCLGRKTVECLKCGGTGEDVPGYICTQCSGTGEVPCTDCGGIGFRDR